MASTEIGRENVDFSFKFDNDRRLIEAKDTLDGRWSVKFVSLNFRFREAATDKGVNFLAASCSVGDSSIIKFGCNCWPLWLKVVAPVGNRLPLRSGEGNG